MNEQLSEQLHSLEEDKNELRSKMAVLVAEMDERLAEIKKILAEDVHERKEAA